MRAIDFDDCGSGHLLYDLAVTQHALHGREDYSELCAAHLRGYREIRPLSADEEALLPTFRAARTLMVALSVASRASDSALWRKRAAAYVKAAAQELERFLRRPVL